MRCAQVPHSTLHILSPCLCASLRLALLPPLPSPLPWTLCVLCIQLCPLRANRRSSPTRWASRSRTKPPPCATPPSILRPTHRLTPPRRTRSRINRCMRSIDRTRDTINRCSSLAARMDRTDTKRLAGLDTPTTPLCTQLSLRLGGNDGVARRVNGFGSSSSSTDAPFAAS